MDNWFLNIQPIKIPRPKRIDNVLRKCECCFYLYNRRSIDEKLYNKNRIDNVFSRSNYLAANV